MSKKPYKVTIKVGESKVIGEDASGEVKKISPDLFMFSSRFKKKPTVGEMLNLVLEQLTERREKGRIPQGAIPTHFSYVIYIKRQYRDREHSSAIVNIPSSRVVDPI